MDIGQEEPIKVQNFRLLTTQICTVTGCFCWKHIKFQLKKYRGFKSYDTEEWCKIWRKTYLQFRTWHEEFDKFLPEHLKVSKLEFWWDPYAQSRKCMSLKFTEELCGMTIKNDAKFEGELTCQFKLAQGNWGILTLALRSLKNVHFNGLLSNKLYKVWAKIVHRSYVS